MTAKKDAKPIVINGYRLTTSLTNTNSGFARWGFAQKGGREYFIKEFLSPVCPSPEAELPAEILERKRAICSAFYQRKRRLYNRLQKSANGNIIPVEAFFLFETRYYIVTEKVNALSAPSSAIAKRDEPDKRMLFKVLANSLASLHANGIVHGDIKPANILLKQTRTGMWTAKLIDFDGSFLTEEPPPLGDIQGDQGYMAPEVCLAMNGEKLRLTAAADVFSLGLVFHEYYTGALPRWGGDCDYAHEALLDGHALVLSDRLPGNMQSLIAAMLQRQPERRPTMEAVFTTLQKMSPGTRTVVEQPKERVERGVWRIPDDL